MKICPGFDFFKVMLIVARKLNRDEFSNGFERAVYMHLYSFRSPSDYKTIT